MNNKILIALVLILFSSILNAGESYTNSGAAEDACKAAAGGSYCFNQAGEGAGQMAWVFADWSSGSPVTTKFNYSLDGSCPDGYEDDGSGLCVPLECPPGESESPDGVCMDTSCPAGESGNFVLSGSWVWACFSDENEGEGEEPEECGVDDNKSPAQCSCESGGGGWLNLGSGDGICSEPAAQECDSNASDYQGTINNEPVCSGAANCSAGETYGLVNGEQVCIPNDAGPPDCGGSVATYDSVKGYECQTPSPDTPQPDGPDERKKNNDLDGDGTPNAFDPDIDGDGTPNESDSDYAGAQVDNSDITASLEAGIAQAEMDAMNLQLKQDQTNEGLADANHALRGIDDNIAELKDFVINSDHASVGDKTGETPTISDTSTRISNAILNHPFISSVSVIPSLSISATCPTFSTASVKYVGVLTMDIHCKVFNDNAGILSALFIGIWTLAAAMIFLKA